MIIFSLEIGGNRSNGRCWKSNRKKKKGNESEREKSKRGKRRKGGIKKMLLQNWYQGILKNLSD